MNTVKMGKAARESFLAGFSKAGLIDNNRRLVHLTPERPKRESFFIPSSVTGWSVALVAVLCATGVAVLALGDREIAMLLFGSAGWGGFLLKMVGRKNHDA
jgi:hypothetical protein